MEYAITLLSGLLTGTVLGLTGGGGSILAVPLLVYLVGEDIHLAIVTSLVAVGATSLIAAYGYFRQSLVKFKIAFLMAFPGIFSIYIGSLANKALSGPLLLILFSILMLFIGYLMLRPKTNNAKNLPSDHSIHYTRILSLGFLTGLASGFFGVGGGFLLVPALYMGANLNMKEAIATSLFIIFLFGIFGFTSYTIQGRAIDYETSVLFTIGGALGAILGVYYAQKINPDKLRHIFAIFTIIMGIGMFVDNLIKLNVTHLIT